LLGRCLGHDCLLFEECDELVDQQFVRRF
jgi:hypothetical protein